MTLPTVAAAGTFGGPAGGITALPGGGFIDFVPAAPTRTLVFTSPDGSHWSKTGEVSGEDAAGITGPVASNGRVDVALGSEPGGVHYAMQQNGAAWVSPDLRSWTKAPVQAAFAGTGWRSTAGAPGGFVATGFSGPERRSSVDRSPRMSRQPLPGPELVVLRELRDMAHRQARTSQILDLRLDALAEASSLPIDRLQDALVDLLAEGFAEAYAATMGQSAEQGACRITGEGTAELRRLERGSRESA